MGAPGARVAATVGMLTMGAYAVAVAATTSHYMIL